MQMKKTCIKKTLHLKMMKKTCIIKTLHLMQMKKHVCIIKTSLDDVDEKNMYYKNIALDDAC